MTYEKLRFNRNCAVRVMDGAEITGRVVYGHFPYGYEKDAQMIPKIVVDQKGVAYRPITIMGDVWGIATNAYLKTIGLTRRQIGGAV
jgi:hypothetical protein